MIIHLVIASATLLAAADGAGTMFQPNLDLSPNSCVISCPAGTAYEGLSLGVACAADYMPACQCDDPSRPGAGCRSLKGNAITAPIRSVEGLKEASASLFDLGMQRLPPNNDLWDGFYRSGSGNHDAFVDLNWWHEREANTIRGAVFAFDETSSDQAMEAGCKEVFRQLNIFINKSLPKIFLHHGWDWDDWTDEWDPLNVELREMFLFTCDVDGPYGERRFEASQRLGEKMAPE